MSREAHIITGNASPFSDEHHFGWYGGPNHGLVELGADGSVFTFRMVAWDGSLQQRIFILQRAAPGSLEETFHDSPGPSAAEEELERFRQGRQDVLRRAGPIEYVVQSEDGILDPLRHVLPVRDHALRERIESMVCPVGEYDDDMASDHDFDEWVALLEAHAS